MGEWVGASRPYRVSLRTEVRRTTCVVETKGGSMQLDSPRIRRAWTMKRRQRPCAFLGNALSKLTGKEASILLLLFFPFYYHTHKKDCATEYVLKN